MYPSYESAVAHDNLIRTALRAIATDHYGDDASPYADADSEHASEKLALAARALVRAVDALPEDQQPIGWAEPAVPAGAEETSQP